MQENTPFGVSELLVQAQRMKKWYEEALHAVAVQYGLTMNELSVLLFLANNPGLDTARDVAELRGLGKSQVSQAVEGLSKRGFLRREADGGDRRVVHLLIAPSGEPLAREAQRIQGRCARDITSGLTPEERSQLETLAEKIAAGVEALAGKGS